MSVMVGTGDAARLVQDVVIVNGDGGVVGLPAAVGGRVPVDTLGTPDEPYVRATGPTATDIVLKPTCRRLTMYATEGTWYSLTGAATATSHYIGKGERVDFNVPASTTISVLQETVAGSVRISELT